MPNYLRGGQSLLSAAALAAGSATPTGYVGTAANIVLYISSDTSTTLKVQATMAPDGTISAGRNTDLTSAIWHDYQGFDALIIGANIPACIDLSPFAPQYVRVINKTGATDIVSGTILLEVNG